MKRANDQAGTFLGVCEPMPLSPSSADEQLVQGCLQADQRAWALLIDRYKPLILSFGRRYGARPQDAADICQFVCAELFLALPQLRKPGSLRSWIMTVASHAAHHWKLRHITRLQRESDDFSEADQLVEPPTRLIEDAERDQLVRDAIAQLPPRARELLRLLFYEDPPTPYQIVAARLGLSNGSVACIRARCLKRLRRILEQGDVPPAQTGGVRMQRKKP